jgi:iron complex outermembrane receptor protein
MMKILFQKISIRAKLAAAVVLFLCSSSGEAYAQSEHEGTADLTELSFAELLDVTVTSVARKEQGLLEAPAAVYVLSGEEIRRSAATSIPEALRYVPGVQVAQIDANKWAVSVRGFNGRFSNKLLVLIDGRIVYTPLYSGVFWDAQDMDMDDIDRIEVIRGPGATLWGANAVNGVINIITKSTSETVGGRLHALAGNEERALVSLRYGGQAGKNGDYRVFGKWFDRDGSVDLNGDDVPNDWDMGRLGFKGDWRVAGKDLVSVEVGAHRGDVGERVFEALPVPPLVSMTDANQDVRGYFAMTAWHRDQGANRSLDVNLSFERTDRRSVLLNENRQNVDLNFQQRLPAGRRQDLIWGAQFRHTGDDIDNTAGFAADPDSRVLSRYGFFAQDEIKIRPDEVHLILGMKLEYNDYTRWEVQPNVRVLWRPNPSQTVWGSIARAVRIPGRAERDGLAILAVGVQPPGSPANPFPLPLYPGIKGNGSLNSENLIAYEAGYRVKPVENLILDLALFWNDYDDLRSLANGVPSCAPSGVPAPVGCSAGDTAIIAPLMLGNDTEGHSKGFELSADWHAGKTFRLRGNYSYLDLDLTSSSSSGAAAGLNMSGSDPEHQVAIHTFWQARPTLQIDLGVRYVGELVGLGIDDYTALDVRIGWHPAKRLELYIAGRNLIAGEHQEFISELRDIPPMQVEPSIFGGLHWEF